MNECFPEAPKATRACVRKQVHPNFPTKHHCRRSSCVARSKFVLSQFGHSGKNCALLVDNYVTGGTAITQLRQTVFALPPCWTWCYRKPSDSARVHSFRPHQDFARHCYQQHPCSHHGFRERRDEGCVPNHAVRSYHYGQTGHQVIYQMAAAGGMNGVWSGPMRKWCPRTSLARVLVHLRR
jgi:hypothetical protein